MTASSPARLVDPLGEQEAPTADLAARAPTEHRGDRIAPSVAGLHGLEAVQRVRAGGFIAAVESIPSDGAAEGTVIEQDPPAGTQLGREAVVTLRLATMPPQVLVSTFDGDAVPADRAAGAVEYDDTERWFAALAGQVGAAPSRRGSPDRSRRKRRPARQADDELRWMAPRAVPASPVTSSTRAKGRARPSVSPHFTAIVSRPFTELSWSRRGAAVAGIAFCAFVVVRVAAPTNSHRPRATHDAVGSATTDRPVTVRGARTSPAGIHVRIARTQTATTVRSQRKPRRRRPAATHPELTRAAPPIGSESVGPPAATEQSATTPEVAAQSAPAQQRSPNSQFAYLGQ
ncbi:MAG TPA: PASTA domain-containing protein [Solirubrobacteraceae bacterium]|nr:PASTA domain-containing protein [Solirubrobacteraceae bacterium]